MAADDIRDLRTDLARIVRNGVSHSDSKRDSTSNKELMNSIQLEASHLLESRYWINPSTKNIDLVKDDGSVTHPNVDAKAACETPGAQKADLKEGFGNNLLTISYRCEKGTAEEMSREYRLEDGVTITNKYSKPGTDR